MFVSVTHIRSLTTLRRQRLLPVEGQVLVSLGNQVRATDPVARANLYTEHLMLDAGQVLRLPPKRAAQMIQREVGEQVEKGDIIAGRRSLAARQLRAPASGQIAAISGGQILLQISDESSLLPARVPGTIIDIAPGRGVIIECTCAWIQATWGNGQLAEGNLHMLAETPQHPLTADQIDMGAHGVILVGGICSQRQALELAAQVPVRGLVLASLTTRLLPLAEKLPFPVALIEGFGQKPMNQTAFQLLINHDGAPATLNAQRNEPFSGTRPELLIPVQGASQPPLPPEEQSFQTGLSVRVTFGENKGQVGKITELLDSSTPFPNGLHVVGANIELSSGSHLHIPLANLDLLG